MDYFDDDNHSGTNEQTDTPKQTKKTRWPLFMSLGIVIGIVIVLLALPSLMKMDFFPNERNTVEESGGQTSDEDGESIKGLENINVDVSTQITDIVSDVSRAIVGVNNIQRGSDFWNQEADGDLYTGSGVIYKKEGGSAFIITNQHVVEDADTLEIVLFDDTTIQAKLLGSDLFSDLAVLEVDATEIEQTIQRGSSDNIKVGEPVITIGNPLGHMFAGSVTQGIISGTQRTIPQDFDQDGRADWQAEVIQTDAAINPGNSGGALINIEGQLIGINSMKINEEAVEGIGFAIPIDSAWPIVKELEETGTVTRPFLGVEIYSLSEVPRSEQKDTFNLPNQVQDGVYVWSVEPLSPASRAGIERLDVIVALDGEPVDNMIELRKVLYQEKEVGEDVDVTFYRDGREKETTLTLGEQNQ